MRAAAVALACAAVWLGWQNAARAQAAPPDADPQADELSRLPPSAAPSPAQPALANADQSLRISVQDAITGAFTHDALPVSIPGLDQDSWENRTSLPVLGTWHLAPGLDATLSDRFNLIEGSTSGFPGARNVRNDLLEAYLSVQPAPSWYVQAGRFNLRNGIALGFNPTDYFKTRTLIDQSSADPSVVRDDRLGTILLRAQYLWSGGAFALAYAPRLYATPGIDTSRFTGFDPLLAQTNASNRVLATLSVNLADLNPQALVYADNLGLRLGANVSRPIGSAIVAYAEWSGGDEDGLVGRAVDFGRQTGTLPANAPDLPGSNAGEHWRNSLAVGASFATAFGLTLNLEYHLSQSALTPADLQQTYRLGALHDVRLSGELLFVRQYAQDQQEPYAQQEIFLRASADNVLVHGLTTSAFAFVDCLDGSVFGQMSASYDLSAGWTLEGFGSADLGAARTEYGSLPQRAAVTLQLTHYF